MDQYFSYLIIFFFHTVILGQNLIYTKTYPSGKPKLISYHIREGVDKVREEERREVKAQANGADY